MYIYEGLKNYTENIKYRFHMPGHGGISDSHVLHELSQILKYDVTETPLTDNLYNPEGFIKISEERITKGYESRASVISAGGATLCINTALALAAGEGKKIIVDRRCHKSVFNSMVLLDLKPVYIYPKYTENPAVNYIDCAELDNILYENEDAACVIVTNPTYYGIMNNVKVLSEVCRKHNKLFIVDNAHGSHLIKWENAKLHPLKQGAHFCIDSLHKTLPALTGGALLHSAVCDSADIKKAMSLFGSTSPSYLISLSVDLCCRFIESELEERLIEKTDALDKVKEFIEKNSDISVICGGRQEESYNFAKDPLRLTLDFYNSGVSAFNMAQILLKEGISVEMPDDRYMVLIVSPLINQNNIMSFAKTLIKNLRNNNQSFFEYNDIQKLRFKAALSPRMAAFAPKRKISFTESEGLVSGEDITPYPPGIPIITKGEIITSELIELYKDRIKTIEVI